MIPMNEHVGVPLSVGMNFLMLMLMADVSWKLAYCADASTRFEADLSMQGRV